MIFLFNCGMSRFHLNFQGGQGPRFPFNNSLGMKARDLYDKLLFLKDILLMVQKCQTTTVWMYKKFVNNGINYQPQLVSLPHF